MPLAIDVVLIPPPDLLDLCIDINRKAESQGLAYRPLGKEDFIPHISLFMGCVDEQDVPAVKESIGAIIDEQQPLAITVLDLLSREDDGLKKAFFHIEKNEALQALHERLVANLGRFLRRHDGSDMLVEGGTTGLGASSCRNINEYVSLRANGNYEAHITLNCEIVDCDIHFPMQFRATTIGLFQMGNGCTCRKRLGEFRLG